MIAKIILLANIPPGNISPQYIQQKITIHEDLRSSIEETANKYSIFWNYFKWGLIFQ